MQENKMVERKSTDETLGKDSKEINEESDAPELRRAARELDVEPERRGISEDENKDKQFNADRSGYQPAGRKEDIESSKNFQGDATTYGGDAGKESGWESKEIPGFKRDAGKGWQSQEQMTGNVSDAPRSRDDSDDLQKNLKDENENADKDLQETKQSEKESWKQRKDKP